MVTEDEVDFDETQKHFRDAEQITDVFGIDFSILND